VPSSPPCPQYNYPIVLPVPGAGILTAATKIAGCKSCNYGPSAVADNPKAGCESCCEKLFKTHAIAPCLAVCL